VLSWWLHVLLWGGYLLSIARLLCAALVCSFVWLLAAYRCQTSVCGLLMLWLRASSTVCSVRCLCDKGAVPTVGQLHLLVSLHALLSCACYDAAV
jgi:hypothetical protein